MRLHESENASGLRVFCDYRKDTTLGLHARWSIDCHSFAHLLQVRIFACVRSSPTDDPSFPIPYTLLWGQKA
jgi:hypothetical protein